MYTTIKINNKHRVKVSAHFVFINNKYHIKVSAYFVFINNKYQVKVSAHFVFINNKYQIKVSAHFVCFPVCKYTVLVYPPVFFVFFQSKSIKKEKCPHLMWV